jgi:gas vesicle protein
MKVTSFLIGLGAGAAVAMLFAPRSGEETREMISASARHGRKYAEKRARQLRRAAGERVADFRDMAVDRAQDLRDMAGERVAEIREIALDAAERGRELIERQTDAVAAAVDAAKETYARESRTA